jgi:2-keto-4-pentenoate hydratase/2-oxohepta-3-ene-1,7-dioic acid hydratase in catechol pathway
MKIGRFTGRGGAERLGIAVVVAGDDRVLDLETAATARGAKLPFQNTMMDFIESGRQALDVGYETAEWAAREGAQDWFRPTEEVRWMIPVEPRACLCAGRNFGRHKDESVTSWASRGVGGFHLEFPTGFIKLASSLVPHKAEVSCPPDVAEFDYEIEIAAIVGKPASRISASNALEAVFGYTIFNDLSAREWQRKEMQNQMILIGKNFPGFGPIGPYILTADDAPDPSEFVLELKVNGEQRQRESCSDMIFGFPELVSFWSKIGLNYGDVIASGTPGGVATHRKPDPFPYYLKAGDVVEASVAQIGVLETRIVERQA